MTTQWQLVVVVVVVVTHLKMLQVRQPAELHERKEDKAKGTEVFGRS